MAKEDYEIEIEYREMLDEVYGTVKIGNAEFWASEVLRECDPIRYQEGLFDYEATLEEDEEEEDE